MRSPLLPSCTRASLAFRSAFLDAHRPEENKTLEENEEQLLRANLKQFEEEGDTTS